MSASVRAALYFHDPMQSFKKSHLISLQQKLLITAEHGTRKMEAAKTDVLMN